jgi:hypothetical protein
MAKKIQKKQIEDGVFVETKATYSAPTQDNEFVQKKYVDDEVAKKADISHTHSWVDITNKPRISVTLADTAISRTYTIGLTGANGSSGKLIIPKAVSWNDVTDKPTFPTLPSWVTQTKPTYDWTEIQNKPEIDKKVRYERVSDLNTLLTEKGILKVADGDNVEGAPVKGSNVWWHFIAGSHLNSLDWQYYLAFPLAIESSDFWFKQKLATQDKSWVKFSGLSQLNGNGLFREWNLEHGLSTYIGNSNVFNVRTGVSGGTSDLLFGVQNDKVVVPTYLESANELKGSELWLDTDKNGNVTRFRTNNDTLTIGNKEWNDLKYLHTKGIKIWGHTDDNKVVLAGGGVTNLSELKNENIKVGGRNLMFNSEFVPFGSIATGAGISKVNKDSEKISEFHVTSGNGNWSTNNIQPKYVEDTLNKTVSVSFDIRVLEGTLKPPTYYPGSFSPYLNLKPIYGDTIELNKWVRVGVTFVSKVGWSPHLGWSELAGKYQLRNFKIEYGNTPTDWSPAPEDLESEIPQYKTITDAHTFLDKDGSIHFGSGSAILNAPSTHFYEMVGFTHSSKQWGFIIAKNIDSDDKRLYVKQVIGGIYKEWFTLEDRSSERSINVTTSTFDITSNVVGQTAHIVNDCVLNFNTMPELTTFAVRKVYDGGSVTFSGSLPPIYTGDTVLNGKKGSTAIIDYGLNNQIFIDIRNI